MRQGLSTKPSANDATTRAQPAPAASASRPTHCPTSLPSSAARNAAKPLRSPTVRHALARYDGPRSLCVRSSATGRLYRFDQPGATEVIDAADMALMRRITDITLL
jgi:hypothetical protein